MKITCKQQDLSRGLSTVSHAVSSRSTLPILANIKLTTDQANDRVKLEATDLEKGITCYIPAKVEEPGSTTTPAKTIMDLIGSLRPIELSISVDTENHIMSIKGQGTSATIKGMEASEYPEIPTVQGNEEPIYIDAEQLKDVIKSVAMAAATDDTRPVLSGVHVETTASNELVFAAADAFRLAVMKLDGQYVLEDPIIIPAKTLNELAGILPKEGNVQMIVTPNRSQVLFHTENVDMVSRLIEGTFPNFRGIMPKDHTTRAVIETKEFAAAVKTVTPFAKDNSGIARIKLHSCSEDGTGPDSLTIEANAEDIGSNVSTIPAHVEGPDQDIIFNVKYLSDVLGVLTTPEVALEVVSSARPGVIKPVNGGDYTYIIMPMSAAK